MGISSIWTAIVGVRVKEITPHRPFSFEENSPTQQVLRRPTYLTSATTASDSQLQHPLQDTEPLRPKRKSRAFSTSNQKTAGGAKVQRRKSWFGAKPEVEEVPAVPQLPAFMAPPPTSTANGLIDEQVERPGTALTTDDRVQQDRVAVPVGSPVGQRKSRRLSLGEALRSRKRSKSTVSPLKPALEKRQSVLGGFREMAPAVPTLPHTMTEPVGERRKSRRSSLGGALTSENKERRKSILSLKSVRRSWWQSSNPDHDDDEARVPPIPALPALIHDDGSRTPDSSIAHTASPDNTEFIDPNPFADGPIKTATRGTAIKQPRPVSSISMSSRKSYVPKSAATGFLRSTGGRSSKRLSLMDDGDGGTICLSEEQQKEWEKLKNLMETMDRRHDVGVVGMLRELEDDEEEEGRRMFSNAQALAALEFGTAR
ncbi:hypothetical protein LTR62_004972 [Meristemomyces frigidus]|uniref:Uncharacterized protein n=1 Tax=Meristemomyces frigidus TaxID=1508187 RepID=A0AAN7TIX4_9PEZI|nr:hypothetical protein LTR62_004972 [Meristemomyces frigidus]